MKIILIYLLLINAAAFLLMLTDKYKAVHHQWRIPEKTLFTAAILGGSLGSILGMYTIRHKTRHASFVVGMPIILVIQCLLGIYFFLG